MAEYFKIEKDDKHYILCPTAYVIENYEAREFPFCYTSLIVKAYNFSRGCISSDNDCRYIRCSSDFDIPL